MGSSCTSGFTADGPRYDNPLVSVHSTSSRGRRGHSGHTSSGDDDDDETMSYTADDASFGPPRSSHHSDEKLAISEVVPLCTTPAPPPRPTPEVPKITWGIELPVAWKKMLCGRMSRKHPVQAADKVVRVYHCANFSDSVIERRAFHEHVYPRLSEHCTQRGAQLHVVDLHCGLRDEFVHGHLLRSFSLPYLRQMCELDPNVILAVFLADRYGSCWRPLTIDAAWVDAMLTRKITEHDRVFFLSCYDLDADASPPVYRLKPVHVKYDDEEGYREGYRAWEKEMIRLRNVLSQAPTADLQRANFTPQLAEELEWALFGGRVHHDNALWVERTLRGWSLDGSPAPLADYLDLHRGQLDEPAQVKLKQLAGRLGERLTERQRVSQEVTWDGERGVDPTTEGTRRYLERLTDKYEAALTGVVDEVIRRKEDTSDVKLNHRGVSRSLQTQLLHNTRHCQSLLAHFTPHPLLTEQLENYIQNGRHCDVKDTCPMDVTPLVVDGPEGSVKSTLAAVVADSVCTVGGWEGSVCVARFVGVSEYIDTLEDLLRSVEEQLSLLFPTTTTSSQQTATLGELLSRVPSSTHLLLLLDDMERLTDDLTSFEWLPIVLPHHVRLVITATTGSPTHLKLKKRLGDEASGLSIPGLNPEETQGLLEQILNRAQQRVPSSVAQHIQQNGGSTVPLTVQLTADILASSCVQDRMPPDDLCSLHKMAEVIVTRNEEKFGRKTVEKALIYLLCSRDGLSEAEMSELLSTSPPLVWAVIRHSIRHFVIVRIIGGIPLTKLHNRTFCKLVQVRYSQRLHKSSEELLKYFDKADNHSLMNGGKIQDNIRRKSKGKSEEKGGNLNTLRAVAEVPHLLMTLGKQERFLTQCLFSWDWLSARLSCSGVHHVLIDIHRWEKSTNNVAHRDVIFLKKFLLSIRQILDQDSTQFGPQLAMALKTGSISLSKQLTYFRTLHDQAVVSLPPLLLPTNPAHLEVLRQGYSDEAILNRLFRVKGDENHIISIATECNEIKIWNIHSRELVRTYTGVEQPRDLKMCDYMRAVVLSNRELVVYELDEGKHVIDLKGVLNIRMPFFGVHDRDHTITMARNRMYVNVMSNLTGEMVTTFKVGEDRFLNSLLVNEQGNLCVCGDAVQKPFPLLVWDLHQRKLIYDLRIHGHEFLTKMAAITKEGNCFVCVAREIEDPDPNFIIVYDLQSGSVFKKWKRDFSATSVAISSRTSLVVSGHEDGAVVVWDLISGTLKFELSGHSRGPDVIRMSESGSHCVTYDSTGRDPNLWYWNVTEGVTVGVLCTTTGVTCAEISADGSVVIVGLPGCDDVITVMAPGRQPRTTDIGVFGDASRKGKICSLAKD